MKKKFVGFLLFFVVALSGCYDRAEYSKPWVNPDYVGRLTIEEYGAIKTMLYTYLRNDTYLYEMTKSNYIALTGDSNSTAIHDNLKEVYAISDKGLILLQKDSLKELMVLLEKERPKFANHMNYSVENELDFNTTLFILYKYIYKDDEKTLNKKITDVTEKTLEYMFTIHDVTGLWDDSFFNLSIGMAEFYLQNGEINKAVICKERMREFTAEVYGVLNNKDYVQLTVDLEKLYRDKGDNATADSCKNELIILDKLTKLRKLESE